MRCTRTRRLRARAWLLQREQLRVPVQRRRALHAVHALHWRGACGPGAGAPRAAGRAHAPAAAQQALQGVLCRCVRHNGAAERAEGLLKLTRDQQVDLGLCEVAGIQAADAMDLRFQG